MKIIEIGGLVSLVAIVATAVTIFTRLAMRVEAIEERQKTILERPNPPPIPVPDFSPSEECHWLPYLGRADLVNIQECPEGTYAKGLGFSHPFGQDLAYQMSYRLRCCALPPFSSEEN